MDRKKLGIIFGGHSSEYEVSLDSVYSVLSNLDTDRYEPVLIGITKEGDWFYYTGSFEAIPDNTWCEDKENLFPVLISENRSNPGVLSWNGESYERLHFDMVFPVLHGKNGEDGTLQGVFEMAGIPVVGCNTMSSALCMDKTRSHRLVEYAGLNVPRSKTFSKYDREEALREINETMKYPFFVKPVRAGSSFGVSRVADPSEMAAAVDLAFLHDSEVIVEEEIVGREIGCAILGNDELFVGRVDEVEVKNGFYDYNEKYTPECTTIYLPARIDSVTEKRVQADAVKIYRVLGCTGLARIDLFLTDDGKIVFNETNTIPGFTSHSRYPKMMEGAGLSFREMLNKLLALY